MIVETEQNYLGSLFILMNRSGSEDILHKAVSGMNEEDLSTPLHQCIFAVLRQQIAENKALDMPYICEQVERRMPDSGYFAYVMDLFQKTPSAASVFEQKKRIKHAGLKRRAIDLAYGFVELFSSTDDPVKALGSAESQIASLAGKVADNKENMIHLADAVAAYIDQVERDIANPDVVVGLKTGFDGIDPVVGRKGLVPGSLVVVGGLPGMGKSGWTFSMLSCAAKENRNDIFPVYSLEMPNSQVVERMGAHATGFGYDDMVSRINGHQSDLIWGKMAEFAAMAKETGVYICDTPNMSVEQIKSDARKLARKGKIGAITVDYLQLLDKPKAERDDLSIGLVTGELKKLARELNTVVILLSQVNRSVAKRRDKRPIMQDFLGASKIEADSDYVFMVHRDIEYNADSPAENIAESICRKNRHGAKRTGYCEFKGGAWLNTDQAVAHDKVLRSMTKHDDDNSQLI